MVDLLSLLGLLILLDARLKHDSHRYAISYKWEIHSLCGAQNEVIGTIPFPHNDNNL